MLNFVFCILYFRGEEDEEEDDGPDTDRKEKVSKLILLYFIDMIEIII